MPRFFVDMEPDESGIITITGDDARHIALSLRCAVGDTIEACRLGIVYECRLKSIRPDEVTLRVLSSTHDVSELPCRVFVFVANPKGSKLDFVTEKCTELGAAVLIPFLSERCVSRPDEGARRKRRARLERIAREAAMQCGRGEAPTIGETLDFRAAVSAAAAADIALFVYENEKEATLRGVVAGRLRPGMSVSVMIGAEGGFSPEEANAAKKAGMIPCGLGPRILRCETAPLYVLSALAYECEL